MAPGAWLLRCTSLARRAGPAPVMFSQQMEEVALAAASSRQGDGAGGLDAGRTQHRGGGKAGKTQTTWLRAKRGQLFQNSSSLGAEIVSPGGRAVGKVPREGAGEGWRGGGRSSACLLTKQLCQLAAGAAWGFAIAPAGWGRLRGGKGGEGKGRPCCSANCCSGLPWRRGQRPGPRLHAPVRHWEAFVAMSQLRGQAILAG